MRLWEEKSHKGGCEQVIVGHAVSLSCQVEMAKYGIGVRWLQEVLYQVQFSVERISVVATKMINDVNR